MSTYIPTIGLEVHAELNCKSKMFCSCRNNPEEKEPNKNVCPICLAHPGALPVPNEDAIEKVLLAGAALRCELAERSKFDRKNYFYPDLPKGYQISQYDMPFCKAGVLEVEGREIRITRIHLEEDTARLAHAQGSGHSLVDFNRAGVALMELVTEPDIVSGKEAKAFGQELQLIFKYLDISGADMEKGQMRVEANISIRKEGETKLGTKVEVKNLNSFRAVEQAIAFELQRQEEVLDAGNLVVQETRGWDEKKGETFSQREKEEAHDYRYFPEPDIPLIHFTKERIAQIQARVPELPRQRQARLVDEYGVAEATARIFVEQKDLGEYFEQAASELRELGGKNFALLANYLVSDLRGLAQGIDFRVSQENMAELILLLEQKKIASAVAKQVLKKMYETGADPDHILQEGGFREVQNEQGVEALAREIFAANPKAVADFKQGKEATLQFLIGKLMAATKGTMDPAVAAELFRKILTE